MSDLLDSMETVSVHGDLVKHLAGANGLHVLQMMPKKDGGIFIFDEDSIAALEAAVSEIESNKDIKGLVVIGSEKGFIAGADVELIAGITSREDAVRMAKRGQDLFTRIEKLSCLTVAAIHGPCLGGGLECALAMDMRIATRDSTTKIGLPEVQLGILPGFGGTQRLPRLIGLPKALELMLKGSRLDGKRAWKRGLIDRVVPVAYLLERAAEAALAGKRPKRKLGLADRILTHTRFGRGFVGFKVGKTLAQGPARFMRAPARILEASLRGLSKPGRDFETEARLLGELAVTDTCKNLIRLFFASEEARKLHKRLAPDAEPIRSAIVVGGGTMGGGIASLMARKGIDTRLVDLSPESLTDALKRHAKTLSKALSRRRMQKHEVQAASDRLSVSTKLSGCRGRDLVLEAIVEDLEIKKKLFASAVENLNDDAVLATNTSSLSLAKMGKDLPKPEQLVGLHFFNPPEMMPLVEVICADISSHEALARAARVASDIGKFPVLVKDCPGFLVNRCLAPYLAQGVEMLLEGVSIERIDQVAEDFGMPMGPLRLLDEIGWDVAAKVCDVLEAGYPERMKASALFEAMTDAGLMGKKSGEGIYRHKGTKAKVSSKVHGVIRERGLGIRGRPSVTASDILDRLLAPLIAEAFLCLREDVVASESELDLAMIMGIGFPPHLGGPIAYARARGLDALLARMQELVERFGLQTAIVEAFRPSVTEAKKPAPAKTEAPADPVSEPKPADSGKTKAADDEPKPKKAKQGKSEDGDGDSSSGRDSQPEPQAAHGDDAAQDEQLLPDGPEPTGQDPRTRRQQRIWRSIDRGETLAAKRQRADAPRQPR